MDTKGRGLFLKDDGDTAILWGEAPGEEAGGGLTAEEKWRILDDNARKGRISNVPAEDYWEITPGGLKHQVYQPGAASESALTGPPRRDRATIPAKGPG